MSGPEWDEKIKRLLRSTPPEVDAVDFAAIREAARREASRRSAARSIWKILAIAAAVPAASPIAKHGGITRIALRASWVEDTERPATSRPSTALGTITRYGIS